MAQRKGGKGKGRGSGESAREEEPEAAAAHSYYEASQRPAPAKTAQGRSNGSTEESSPVPASSSSAKPPSSGTEEGAIEGLREAFAVANMKRDIQNQGVAWCQSRGAECLGDVMQVFDTFAAELKLKPLEKKRLEKALNAAIERYGPGENYCEAAAEAPPAASAKQEAPEPSQARRPAREPEPAKKEPAERPAESDQVDAAKPSNPSAAEAPDAASAKGEEPKAEERELRPAQGEEPGAAAEDAEAARSGSSKQASALAALQEAQAAGDAAALAAAIPVAEAAQVDADELAKAKKALFKLQKEKREKGKLERAKSTAAAELAVAVAGDSAEALRQAMQKAEEVGVAQGLDEARTRLVTLEEEEKRECIKLAFEDLEYAISQEDAEAAQLALEDAAGMGASEEELQAGEERISALRLKLDPEGEARRRRVEARKAKAGEKKWNFSGKSDNRIINDRFREHEAELERQRMLAFRARGRFKAEDEGEEGAEKGIKKLRAEVSKEFGAVPLPKLNEASAGFAWGRVPKEESEAPRCLTLRAHVEAGAGIDLHASWWGMVVDGIDPEPGQPGLRLKDSLVQINGTSLIELPDEDCEQRFADLFGDGCVVKVEPHVQVAGILAPPAPVDKTSLQADLERFSGDWGIELRMEESGGNNIRIILEGAQSAVRQSKPELQNLMGFYAQAQASS